VITDGSNDGKCDDTEKGGATKGEVGRDSKPINWDNLQRCLKTAKITENSEWLDYGDDNNGMGSVIRCDDTVDLLSGSDGWKNPEHCYDACKNCLSESMSEGFNQMWCGAKAGNSRCWMGYRIPDSPSITDGTNLGRVTPFESFKVEFEYFDTWAANKCLRELPHEGWISEDKPYRCPNAPLEITLENIQNWESASDCYNANKNCISEAFYARHTGAQCSAPAREGSKGWCKMKYKTVMGDDGSVWG
jgi:hypothetical protein